MPKKFSLQEGKIVVETRGLVDSLELIRERLKSLGATKGEVEEVEDEHYADLKEVSLEKHTYEEIGRAARVRRITSDDKTLVEAVIKEGVKKTSAGVFSHDAVRTKILVRGDISKLDTARKLVKEQGFPELILVIKKKRENYWLDDVSICLDSIEEFGPAMEIRAVAKDKSQIAEIKKEEVDLVRRLGVEERDILDTSMTHMIISSRIRSDPKVRIPYLKKELQKLEKNSKRNLEEAMLSIGKPAMVGMIIQLGTH